MNQVDERKRIFRLVFSITPHFKNSSEKYQEYLVNKIVDKLIEHKHHTKDSDFIHMYSKYYLAGLTDWQDFDVLILDGAFHSFGYDNCKKFFLECYSDNRYLYKKFRFERNLQSKPKREEFIKWLELNFSIAYNDFYKLPHTKKEDTSKEQQYSL